MKTFSRYMVWIQLLLWGCSIPIMAQSSGDGYNPDNPLEPTNPSTLLKYSISLEQNYDDAGVISGAGKYSIGTSVRISASAKSGYKFLYWKKKTTEEIVSNSMAFTYIVEATDVTFTAVYEKAKRISVKTSLTNAGYVYGGGSDYYCHNVANIYTVPMTDYVFRYWIKDDDTSPYSAETSFQYEVEETDVVFTAVYDYLPEPYNPENPSEPSSMEDNVKYSVRVSTNIPNAGAVSGGGRYLYGRKITIATSPNEGYNFVKWQKNGADYTSEKQINYTTEKADVDFVAVYEKVVSPPVPESHRLFLAASPDGSCTFSSSNGREIKEGDSFTVTAYPGTDHIFMGWYQGNILLTTSTSYSTYMGGENVFLTAKCKYSPDNPEEPNNPGGYIEELEGHGISGDANNDGVVDMVDVIALINIYLGKTTDYNAALCDVNKDGLVDMVDVISVTNTYLGK